MSFHNRMIVLFGCVLLLLSYSSAEISLQEVFTKDVTEKCGEVFLKLSPMLKAKMLDASSKLITSGLMEGNIVDLGDFDECLSIENESSEIYGKYCLATVEINTFLSALHSTEGNTTSLLLQQTQTKIEKFANSKLAGEISSLLKLYTSFARFGICIPDKCKPKNIGFLHLDEEKCSTKNSNDEMDLFAFTTLVILYIFIFIAILSTCYDIINQKLSLKPKHPIFVAFSCYTNGKKLFGTQTNSDQLSCLHGIKVLSMVWVVLGHSYLNMFTTSLDNLFYVNEWIDNPTNMLILSATLSVDTFFMIGGLLTVYVFMKSPPMKTKEGLKKIPMLYIHRYLRLTPAFAMMVLIYASGLVKYFGDGPKWYTLNSAIENCKENWWAALLYVQNYMDYSKMCVVQTWYLSADFQLFLITPFFLIPLRKWPKYIIPSFYIIAVVGMIIPFIIGYTNKFGGVGYGSTTSVFANNYYFVTHARFAPYVIGMIAGYYIFLAKKKLNPLKLEMCYVFFLWILALTGIVGCIFDGFKLVKHSDDAWADGIYMGFNRSAWSLSISLLVFLCSTGYGGPIQKFLSMPLFNIVAKLTYSMYLVHYIVILCVNGVSRTKFHFSNFSIMSNFFTYFILTFIISILYCLIFESPMIIIERIIFPTKRNNQNKELPK
ncbi:nose resistant to fluoxetine protein 6-like [Harmonia axyridis]|uniref:nose resistant to fluoxetine protein 6-like n=1 Tax=Harmonia axyridis TaxID=115357 RepID=UPI001E2757CB|nr:nose resistant to fluoxetine protein 6-like [Harmonia axyridis]